MMGSPGVNPALNTASPSRLSVNHPWKRWPSERLLLCRDFVISIIWFVKSLPSDHPESCFFLPEVGFALGHEGNMEEAAGAISPVLLAEHEAWEFVISSTFFSAIKVRCSAVLLFVSSLVQPAAFSSSFPCGSALPMLFWALRLPSWHVQRTLRRSSLLIRMSLRESHLTWVIFGPYDSFTRLSEMKHCCIRCWVYAEQKMAHALSKDLCHKKTITVFYMVIWYWY